MVKIQIFYETIISASFAILLEKHMKTYYERSGEIW